MVFKKMDEIKLALEMNKLVHNECKDVPHDIGLRLLEIVKRNVNEQLHQSNAVKSVCDCVAFHKSDECYKLGCKVDRGCKV